MHVGQRFTMGFYSLSQTPASSSSAPVPHLRLAMTLVGIVEFNNAVVQDDVDANGAQNALVTPTLTRRLLPWCSFYSFSYLKLEHGSRDVAAVEKELRRVFPSSLPFDPHAASIVVAKAERAVKPETLAIGVFGGIAALATLVIAAQVMGRQLRSGADDLGILRALGADPATTMTEGVPGIIGAVVGGALLAAAVAVGLSPLAPIGAVRAVYPAAGHRLRLDGPRAGHAGPGSRAERGRRRHRLPDGAPSRRPPRCGGARVKCCRARQPRRACRRRR